MDAIQCIKTRRSIRKYQDKDIPRKLIDEILDCARHAPSSHNSQSWQFFIVQDNKKKEELSKVHKWATFVGKAPSIIIVGINKDLAEFTPSDISTSSVAAENILLSAHALGLGGCWVYLKDNEEPETEEKAKQIIECPSNTDLLCMIPIGYPAYTPREKKLRPIDEISKII